ncbi:MAG: phosphatidylserine decarboxylase [Euryarchaeota archaeon]|jgi:phosphatidylserine decarboxylase|nr:phosphatidylserine decarboxylase [Euryarchaeota archaeon]
MIRIADGGMPWLLASFAFSFLFLGAFFLTSAPVSIFLLIISVFFFLISCLLIVFFRDPERSIGGGIVAVADGNIREIANLQDAEVGDCLRISTFMNIQNVHVNRMPFAGTIEKLTHHPGGHVPAFQKESDANERVVLLIKTDIGMVKIVQIAGAVARRIVPYVAEGTELKKGEKIGLIRMGSRVDLYLPAQKIKTLMIHVHDRIKAGEDTIAEIHD